MTQTAHAERPVDIQGKPYNRLLLMTVMLVGGIRCYLKPNNSINSSSTHYDRLKHHSSNGTMANNRILTYKRDYDSDYGYVNR